MVSSGGRVLTVVGLGDDLGAAREAAYEGIEQIGLAGSFYRHDIAARAAAGEIGDRSVEVNQLSVPNVLANRYASAAMREVWSPEQQDHRRAPAVDRRSRRAARLGVDFGGADPDQVIAAYERVVEQVDLASIAEREKITRHDVKARIEEFNALAGFEHVHKGMTSRDLTENVEQLQFVSSLRFDPRQDHRHAGPAGPAGRPVRRPADRRPFAQRGGPGDHPRQAVRDGGRGAADRRGRG